MNRKRATPPSPESETLAIEDLQKAKRILRAASSEDVEEFRRWAKRILKKRGVWPSRYQAEAFAKVRDLSQLWGRHQFEALDPKFKRWRRKKKKRI